jgi:hypothetical protein
MLLLFQNIAQQAKVYNILQHDCLVLLIMLQDLEGLWKQNEVSLNKSYQIRRKLPYCVFLCESRARTKDAFQKF